MNKGGLFFVSKCSLSMFQLHNKKKEQSYITCDCMYMWYKGKKQTNKQTNKNKQTKKQNKTNKQKQKNKNKQKTILWQLIKLERMKGDKGVMGG